MEIDFLKQSKPALHLKLVQHGITQLASILIVDSCELQELLQISEEEVEVLKQTISAKQLPKARLGNVPDTRLSTGCAQINSILHGGLPTTRVLELYGCSGSGKTQLCLQLLITVQLPPQLGGLDKSAVYICTEPPFPSRRFHELCDLAPERFDIEKNDFESNVYINVCFDTEELMKCLQGYLPNLMANVNVGLIVIDTIASVFRGEDGTETNYKERDRKFREIIRQIRQLAALNDAVILCVNQVVDDLEKEETVSALGASWANLVAQKYEIARAESSNSQRTFAITYSYESEPASVTFDIKQDGIH